MGETIRVSDNKKHSFVVTDSVERLGPWVSVYGVICMSRP